MVPFGLLQRAHEPKPTAREEVGSYVRDKLARVSKSGAAQNAEMRRHERCCRAALAVVIPGVELGACMRTKSECSQHLLGMS